MLCELQGARYLSTCPQTKTFENTSQAFPDSGYATTTSSSRRQSECSSSLVSRDPSPSRQRSSNQDLFDNIPPAQAHIFDELLERELLAAEDWLDRLNWDSVEAYENMIERSMIVEENYRRLYRCSVPEATIDEDSRHSLILADSLAAMVDRAWNCQANEPLSIEAPAPLSDVASCESSPQSEESSNPRPMQVHVRYPLPRKQDAIYNVRYKTIPCLHFQKQKWCPLADNCHFAHGPNELKRPIQHPKFRTRVCKYFVKCGHCPYGYRCHFSHQEE